MDAADYINVGEINSAEDDAGNDRTDDDKDSQPDNDPDNDAGGAVMTPSDDVVDGDGTGTPGDTNPATDEDDADPAKAAIFDLALRKTTDFTGIAGVGEGVLFTIEVINQGNTAASNITLVDYVPDGFELTANPINSIWSGTTGDVTTTLNQVLPPGEKATAQIMIALISGYAACEMINMAEIKSVFDETGTIDLSNDDRDSKADMDKSNDAGGLADSPADDFIDGDGTGIPGDGVAATDEDDKDSERIEVCDDVVPTIAGTPADITIDCEVTLPTPPVIGTGITADDLCDEDVTDMVLEQTDNQDNDPGNCEFYNYEITRVWTATDDCANTFQTMQIITVQDTTKPQVSCAPEDLIFECAGLAGNEGTANLWNQTNINNLKACASDNCAPNLNIIITSDYDYNNLSDECGLTGSLTVTYTITDVCGNFITRQATFTVKDETNPTLSIECDPKDDIIECDGISNNGTHSSNLE